MEYLKMHLMGKPHLHIAFIEEGSKLFAVPGLGISAVLHVYMEPLHAMRRQASAQTGMSLQNAGGSATPHGGPQSWVSA